jgi:hypothetical protein
MSFTIETRLRFITLDGRPSREVVIRNSKNQTLYVVVFPEEETDERILFHAEPAFEISSEEQAIKYVKRGPLRLRFVPRMYYTYDLCMNAVGFDSDNIQFVPTHLQTLEMCSWAMIGDYSSPKLLRYVYKKFRTLQMCKNAVRYCFPDDPECGDKILRLTPEEFRGDIERDIQELKERTKINILSILNRWSLRDLD